MKKWEYLCESKSPKNKGKDIDIYGEQGWELASTAVIGNTIFFFFKRPLQDPPIKTKHNDEDVTLEPLS